MIFDLGRYQPAADYRRKVAHEQQWARRLWQRDHTLWQPDPTEVANRLGWLDCPSGMTRHLAEIHAFVAEVRTAGFTRVLLLGMGGSSLAPEVFRTTFGVAPGHLDLTILDSTAPRAVRERLLAADPATTLYLVSTKSGGTVETLSAFLTAYRHVVAALGTGAGAHFAAITDPGSGLEQMAEDLGFRRIFRNDPTIGGRYSALSHFGLVPAALLGVDLARLLATAQAAADACRAEADNPGVSLGTALGELARAGRDKLTLLLPEPLTGFGDWVEQLVAESLGKQGTGVLPVVGEVPDAPGNYGADRVFALFGTAGDAKALAAAGHPVVRLPLADPYDLGYQFVLWEVATALAGVALGINPFDQPDVESAKIRAREMVAAYRGEGSLPAPPPSFTGDGVSVWAAFSASSPADALQGFLAEARTGDYLAVQAYLPPDAATNDALAKLRLAAREHSRLAVTVGYGPRFLHSTGQLHKGDAGNGLFLQLTCDHADSVPIPDGPNTDASSLDFATLIAAQALGDRQALLDVGRRVLRLHLGADPLAHLAAVTAALES